ncbi:MAG: sodium ion-translocating decarboxylase subunit beta [Bacteroidales bacterium]|nr:sodium ion-translocating decarboxylase subunit beta [Bacteroidales bacterium]
MARIVQSIVLDTTNYLLMHIMAPNIGGVIGLAVAARIMLSFLK